MQLRNVDNVSFGRIGFVDKSVKKHFMNHLITQDLPLVIAKIDPYYIV